LVPQLPQNVVPGGLAVPHLAQVRAFGVKVAPQLPQNFMVVGIEAPH